jgi:hypothetical protein
VSRQVRFYFIHRNLGIEGISAIVQYFNEISQPILVTEKDPLCPTINYKGFSAKFFPPLPTEGKRPLSFNLFRHPYSPGSLIMATVSL